MRDAASEARSNVRFGPKADIARDQPNVSFTPKADIRSGRYS